MSGVVLVLRLALAAMFVVAGAAKLADLAGSREALEGFGVPVRVVRPLAVALPVAELMIAGALLPVVLAPWGAVAACALLSAFVVVIALNLAHGRRTDCHCFGGLHSAPAGPLALVRNTLLALAAGLVAVHGFAGSPASATAWVDRLGPGERVGLLVGAPALVLVAGMAWVCVVLLRRYGRLLLRLEEFEGVVSAGGGATGEPGLPMMEPAPEFSARSVTGEPISLSSLRAEGRLTLLVFADPACGPCRRTLAAVAGWQEDYYERLTIAVITSASPAEASELRDEYRLEQVLVDSDREIAKAYRIPGTPAGMLLYGDGRVARPVALGAPRLEALLDLAMTEPSPPAPSRNGAPVAAAAGAAGLALAGVAVGAPSARAASNDPELQSIRNVLDAAAPHLDAIEKASATAIKALATRRLPRGNVRRRRQRTAQSKLRDDRRAVLQLRGQVAALKLQTNRGRGAQEFVVATLDLFASFHDQLERSLAARRPKDSVRLAKQANKTFNEALKKGVEATFLLNH